MRTVVMMLMMALLISGCAHRFTQEQVEMTLAKGKTTKQEVRAAFGEPYNRYVNPGIKAASGGKERLINPPFEVWIYSPHNVRLIDALDPEALRVIFNAKGIVSNFDYTADEEW